MNKDHDFHDKAEIDDMWDVLISAEEFARQLVLEGERCDHELKFPGHDVGFTLCYTCRLRFGEE